MLGLHCCAGFSLVAEAGGYSFVAVWQASLGAKNRLWGMQASVAAALWAQQLQLPGSRAEAQNLWHSGLAALRHVGSSQFRMEPVSSALLDGFFTTEPPGKPYFEHFFMCLPARIYKGFFRDGEYM